MPAGLAMKNPRNQSPSPTSCAVIGSLQLMEESAKLLQGEVPPAIPLRYGSYTIGRGSHSDIHIRAQMDGKFIISRTHALLQVDKKGVVIKDLESTNGVFVNEKRINECELSDGDIIRFAGMSEVPVGTVLTCTNASVLYKVLFNDTSSKRKGDAEEAAEALAAMEDDHLTTGQPTSNGHSSRNKVPILAASAPRPASNADQSMRAKRARVESDGEIQQHSASSPPSDILAELRALKDIHARQLSDLQCKFDSLQHVLLQTHQNGVASTPPVGKAQASPNPMPQPPPPEMELGENAEHAEPKVPHVDTSARLSPPLLQLQQPPPQLSGAKPCVIEASSLRSLVTCALCQELLCLPVVLRCSHGYCWFCIEKSIRREGASYLCPVCCDPLPPSSSSSAHTQLYHRSDHLDSIVWLLLEAGESKATEIFEGRTKEHRKGLAAMGIDSTRAYEFAEGAQAVSGKQEGEQAQKASVTCDYCGSTLGDHSPDNCPHRLHEESESEQTLDDREEDL